MENIIRDFSHAPKKIFLLDSMGALLTSVLLGIVLPALDKIFFMPGGILHLLSGIAFGFFVYSLFCHFFIQTNHKPFLGVIILANLIYCVLSIGVMAFHFSKLSLWDLLYFAGEIGVIILLVWVEFRVWKKLKRK